MRNPERQEQILEVNNQRSVPREAHSRSRRKDECRRGRKFDDDSEFWKLKDTVNTLRAKLMSSHDERYILEKKNAVLEREIEHFRDLASSTVESNQNVKVDQMAKKTVKSDS